jgi:CelD/BcsL family acetyltransferase involved in cellulose biosynthesis
VNWYEVVAGKTFEDYLLARPSSLTNTSRRRLATLQKGSRASFHLHRPGKDVEPFIADYNDVHRQSWQQTEPFPLFIPELIRFANRLGALRIGVLKIDGENAAAQFWIVWKRKALIFKLAFVSKFRAHSPGTLLTMHMLQDIFIRDAPEEIDFGRGDDDYKKLWVSMRRERWGIEAVNPRTTRGAFLAVRMALAAARSRILPR